MIPRPFVSIAIGLSAAVLSLALAHPIEAASIAVSGTPGVAGSVGVDGSPGTDGGAGGAGGPAVAVQPGPGADNDHSTATGGTGGAGGAGGNGAAAAAAAGNGGVGGVGGSATANTTVTLPDHSAHAVSTATGGAGGAGGQPGTPGSGGAPGSAGNGGAGGSANASVFSTSTSTVPDSAISSATATATATGGGGGNATGAGSHGGAGGAAHAEATTQAFLGISDTVTQVGGRGGAGDFAGRGGDSSLEDASHFDPNTINVFVGQMATGGAGGNGRDSRGGDAHSAIHTHLIDAGSVLEEISAVGGNAISGAEGARGGDASASGFIRDDSTSDPNNFSDLVLTVSAVGGLASGAGSHGGSASVAASRVEAGGDRGGAEVQLGVVGGSGETGADAVLDNAASGEGARQVVLRQMATGGNGIARAGSAVNRLDYATSTAELSLTALATGGSGSAPSLADGTPQITGDASVEADGAGDHLVTITTNALGGNANARGSSGGNGWDGGDATASAHGLSSANDPNLVTAVEVTVTGAARGGDGGAASNAALATGGRGGDGTSSSAGEVSFATEITVTDQARGGAGGAGPAAGGGQSGGGGDAHSSAVASGSLATRAFATSIATAGVGGNTGAANSLGHFGAASSDAVARADGNAIAFAYTHHGTDPTAHATALTNTRVSELETSYSLAGQVPGTFAAEALLGTGLARGGVDLQQSGVTGGIVALGLPGPSDVNSWTTGSPNVRNALPGAQVLAVGSLQGAATLGSGTGSLHLELGNSLAPGDKLYLAFLGTQASGIGFDVLHVQFDANAQTTFSADFASPSAAAGTLRDAVFLMGDSTSLGSAPLDGLLTYAFSFSGTGNAYASDFMLFTVPEPGATVLLLLTVAGFGLRRR
jgi:hypothetical protein